MSILAKKQQACPEMHSLAREFRVSQSETLARQHRVRWLEIDLAFGSVPCVIEMNP